MAHFPGPLQPDGQTQSIDVFMPGGTLTLWDPPINIPPQGSKCVIDGCNNDVTYDPEIPGLRCDLHKYKSNQKCKQPRVRKPKK
jgi:hypothetical protein